jgi:alpha-amylase
MHATRPPSVQTYGVDGLRIDTIPYVPAAFWSEFSAAAGVYTVGEIDMGDVQWVASYQGAVSILPPPAMPRVNSRKSTAACSRVWSLQISGTLSYPLYFSLMDVFGRSQSMNQIQSTMQAYTGAFKDLSLLGVFESNHGMFGAEDEVCSYRVNVSLYPYHVLYRLTDNPRFLNVRPDTTAYMNHLLFVYMSIGIPIGYYGSEQGFSGGNDPACREILWPTKYNLQASGCEIKK